MVKNSCQIKFLRVHWEIKLQPNTKYNLKLDETQLSKKVEYIIEIE